jgi:hypothetical protein
VDLAKWTNGTFPQASFPTINSLLLLHIAWLLSEKYTVCHPSFIAQFRVAIKDFRVNLV